MKNIGFAVIFLITSNSFAYERNTKVESWDKVRVDKGYILSNDIYNNRHCDKVWSKQIPLFKKQNPKIKNPDLLYVGQDILVQNCATASKSKNSEMQVSSETAKEPTSEKKITPYIGLSVGANYLKEHDGDSEKLGYLLGIKIGADMALDSKNSIGLALGYLFNDEKTLNDSGLGKYRIQNHLINLEGHYDRKLSERFKLGALLNLVTGKDVSLQEKEAGQSVGAYAGISGLYALSSKMDFETNLQQRIDELSRTNLFLNLGIRFKF